MKTNQMTDHTADKRFDIGVVTMTQGAICALLDNNVLALSLLTRHQSGDWGEIDEEDKAANNKAVEEGTRIISSYVLYDGLKHTRIRLLTEADRSKTSILLPREYQT